MVVRLYAYMRAVSGSIQLEGEVGQDAFDS